MFKQIAFNNDVNFKFIDFIKSYYTNKQYSLKERVERFYYRSISYFGWISDNIKHFLNKYKINVAFKIN